MHETWLLLEEADENVFMIFGALDPGQSESIDDVGERTFG